MKKALLALAITSAMSSSYAAKNTSYLRGEGGLTMFNKVKSKIKFY